MNIENDLKKITGIENIKEDGFVKIPKFPYIVYVIEKNSRGADNVNKLNDNKIAIALYDSKKNLDVENKIENWLDNLGIEFYKDRNWQNEEKSWETYYEFNILEKKGET